MVLFLQSDSLLLIGLQSHGIGIEHVLPAQIAEHEAVQRIQGATAALLGSSIPSTGW